MINHFKKKQKNSPKKRLVIIGLGLLLGVIFFGLMVANLRLHEKKKQLNVHLENLQQKVKQLQTKNDKLQEGISQSDNPKYIEKVAREELDLQQPGEKVISFIDPVPTEPFGEALPQNILQWMIGALTGWFK